jgi:uncharacterized protein (UPF0332 family)
MKETEPTNIESVLVYLLGAEEALRGAKYNLDGGFYGIAVNRAYYAFFYAATALLLTLDVARSKHSGVLAAFRQHFVRSGIFSAQDSRSYGEAFELRNMANYEMLGEASEAQARATVERAYRFFERCEAYLAGKGCL